MLNSISAIRELNLLSSRWLALASLDGAAIQCDRLLRVKMNLASSKDNWMFKRHAPRFGAMSNATMPRRGNARSTLRCSSPVEAAMGEVHRTPSPVRKPIGRLKGRQARRK